MLLDERECAEIARYHGRIQYNMRAFLDSEVPGAKKSIARELLNQIREYKEEVPKKVKVDLSSEKNNEFHLSIDTLERKCEECLKN